MENTTYKIISRNEAKEQGLKHYFTGKPCKHGHVSMRFTKRAQCCECNRLKVQQDWQKIKTNPELLEASRAAGRQRVHNEDPERKRERSRRHARKKRLDPAFRAKESEYMRSPKRLEYLRAWNKEKMEDPAFRIARNLRNRIWYALAGKAASERTLRLLGCTIDELKTHLESQFQPGMTWENYSYDTWHVDHIRPCASFDLTDPEQQNQCFHYTNLQPLWAKDNLSKSDKWEEAA